MDGLYSTEQAADYIVERSSGAISRRAVIWYVRDKKGREKAARDGVLQGAKVGHSRVFTQAQLDEFIARYPQISDNNNGWDTRRQKQVNS